MNVFSRYLLLGLILALGGGSSVPLRAQENATPAATAPAEDGPQATEPDAADRPDDTVDVDVRFRRFDRNGDAVVAIGEDAELAAGQSTNAVVAILGSATSAGNVDESVVSILGSTRVTGTVGESAVAILGNVYVNGRVDGEVVAILGNVELGPEADIGDDVVVIGGTLVRDAAARVGGRVSNVAMGLQFGRFRLA